jgi:hypothetical protein
MGRKKLGDFIVVKGHAGGAQAQRVGAQVHLAANDSRFQLSGPVAAVAVLLKYGLQISHEKRNRAGIGAQGLLETQMARPRSQVAFPQKYQLAGLWVKII